MLNKYFASSAEMVLIFAGVAQLIVLIWLADSFYSSVILVTFFLPCGYFMYRLRMYFLAKKTSINRASNSLLFVLFVGGLGMSLGSALDSIILSKGLCMAGDGLPVDLVYKHHHGIEAITSYMVLLMLLFCLPSCVVFCSVSLANKHDRLPELCGHGFAALSMLIAMLYLPHFAQYCLTLLAEYSSYSGSIKHFFPAFIVQHSLMLISMAAGSLLGYRLFGCLRIFLPFPGNVSLRGI